jgi:hypothetical protein
MLKLPKSAYFDSKLIVISILVSIAHFFEDLILVIIGRHTEIHIGIIAVSVITFGLFIGTISRHPRVKKYLAD